MLNTIGNWIFTIPIDNPWRAIVLVLIVLAIAFTLHMLWELGFSLAGWPNKMIARMKASRSASVTSPSLVMSVKSDRVN